ncbi:MAG TPA: OmpH family outer membrane protein [Thermoanaerobaculia bacterium]|nr:OmpH family outer membrane protein [Thermoanaerobaculia bacterium]
MPRATSVSVRRLPVLALGAALALSLAAPLAAQAPAKVAVIDVERILLESERGKSALQELEAVRKQKQEQGETLQKEINDLRTRLTEGQLSLAQDKIAELQKQLEDKVIALRRFQDDANRDLSKKRDDILGRIEQSVFPVINQIGQEGGYTLIFNKYNSGLVYADEAVDITTRVIERYNQANPAGE